PDIIWALYLGLFLFAVTVALRFPTGPKLRAVAGMILLLSAFAALAIEPYYLGRTLSDLTIEWVRDAIRLLAGLGMLLLLLVDVLQSRRERDRMMVERIEALETQAETDRRLLKTEREYARAREAAARTKAQLAAASHDIRQPIVGLRAAVLSEAERLSPALRERLRQAIDYLELLTHEYSNRGLNELQDPGEEAIETYPVDLVTQAVGSMFRDDAAESGIEFHVSGTDRRTSVPALALIRATSNLVANALRHAQASTIRVSIDDLGEHCLIHVEDNGRGMNAAELAKAQITGAKSDKSAGDGLGLAIVHDLAGRHGFSFEIVSEPERGTKATLTIPVESE
ncbi:MAG: sensor histidine kinase, partial [Pseudomonadota bacterium]